MRADASEQRHLLFISQKSQHPTVMPCSRAKCLTAHRHSAGTNAPEKREMAAHSCSIEMRHTFKRGLLETGGNPVLHTLATLQSASLFSSEKLLTALYGVLFIYCHQPFMFLRSLEKNACWG